MSQELVDQLGGEKRILEQVNEEYKICVDFIRPKIAEWQTRLVIYNNQKRDKAKVGDPLLFTIHNTLLSSFYNDELIVTFQPREEGDIQTAENLDTMAQFDFEQMGMNVQKYNWLWDSIFFGRGLLLLQEFNRDKMHPIPQVIDPLTFLRDPRAVSVNGDASGYGALRFWGREIALMKAELKNHPSYFNIGVLKEGKELDKLLQGSSRQRSIAQEQSEDIKINVRYNLLEWYTHFKGKKYLITLGNDKTKIVRIEKLEDKWALIDRPFFPVSHDWDGVSLPDIIEDKQRARAVIQNLILDSAKSDVNPMYLFDENRVKNKSDLNFGFNKFVRIAGPTTGAVIPMHKPTVHAQVGWIMDLLDLSSQKAAATPDLQMGHIMARKRTLGELKMMAGGVSTRYASSLAIFGWSEKKFWEQWYFLYKKHFKANIDKKIIRLSGLWGSEFRPLKRDNIIAHIDPDIKIESKFLTEEKRTRDRLEFQEYLTIAAPVLEESGQRFALKRMAKLSGLKNSEIQRLFPPTFDELMAEEENKLLTEGKQAHVEIGQNHIIHKEIHAKLNASDLIDKHIATHSLAMILQKKVIMAAVSPMKMPVPREEPVAGITPPPPAEAPTPAPIEAPLPKAEVI